MSGVTPEFNLFHRLLWPEFHDSLVIKVDITALNIVNTKFPDTFLTISQISFQFPAEMFFLAFVLSNTYYSFCQEISWQVEAMDSNAPKLTYLYTPSANRVLFENHQSELELKTLPKSTHPKSDFDEPSMIDLNHNENVLQMS